MEAIRAIQDATIRQKLAKFIARIDITPTIFETMITTHRLVLNIVVTKNIDELLTAEDKLLCQSHEGLYCTSLNLLYDNGEMFEMRLKFEGNGYLLVAPWKEKCSYGIVTSGGAMTAWACKEAGQLVFIFRLEDNLNGGDAGQEAAIDEPSPKSDVTEDMNEFMSWFLEHC